MTQQQTPIPIVLLTGFLGSGKTTLLSKLLEHYKAAGLKPAVIMNELGDVNLDGLLVEREGEIPMSEMLSGCICCSIRQDIGMELLTLVQEHKPDIILIETTGAANPLEAIDGVTEAALLVKTALNDVVTVVDGPELLRKRRSGEGQAYPLMKSGIVSATEIVLNKIDLLQPEERVEAQQLLHELNPFAKVVSVSRCEVSKEWLNGIGKSGKAERALGSLATKSQPDNNHVNDNDDEHTHNHQHDTHAHDHGHVMALTYYLDGPVDSGKFEELLHSLPDNVYRAKGIITFTDAASRFLFQYAYGEVDFMAIRPQGPVEDVAVFIGEHFVREDIVQALKQLQGQAAKETLS